MRRLATDQLETWALSPRRKPLLVRGARQVGKTWAVTDFAQRRFPGHAHVVDLERRRDLHHIFAGDLGATRLLSQLEISLGSRISVEQDLLFLDEIQACPRAIVALRYFYEELPALHVVAAGSLLEFALGQLSFPVGRVQFLNVHPLTFLEFLWATGREAAAEIVAGRPTPIDPAAHSALLGFLREYLFVGGLPEAVRLYADSGRLRDAFLAQDEVVQAYRADFGKYAPRVDGGTLDEVLTSVARTVGTQVVYSRLAAGPTQPTLKSAFSVLERAQVVQRVTSVKHVGLPLGSGAAARRFKAIVVDLGLQHRLSGLSLDAEYAKADLLSIYEGALAEQFVGQELHAANDSELYYWARDAKSSTAEVDYLLARNDRVVPIEVKSGPSGRLRSMHQLLKECPQCAPGVVLSTVPYAELPEQGLLFVPLYFAGALTRQATGA